MKTSVWISSSFGPFFLTASEKGLVSLRFPGNKDSSPSKKFSLSRSSSPNLRRAKGLLERYFKGYPVSWKSLGIDFPEGSTFQRKVLQALQRVPYGKRITYGDLARAAGFPKAARAVGSVLKKNRLPLILPCHRVVRTGGALGEYAQGAFWKKRLLAREETGLQGLRSQ